MIATKQIAFSEDQRLAISAVDDWDANPDSQQTLTLGGYAGTGKTTLIAHFADKHYGVQVAALCGKAANVLRGKGVNAITIHSLIYTPETVNGKVTFVLKDSLPGCDKIVIDEASMVNNVLYQDLLSFGLPVLFVGDHGQLEPIGDNPNLMHAPEVRLENIHRQAKENPILRLATAFREGRRVPYWRSPCGSLAIENKSGLLSAVKERPDAQVICGFNGTRHLVNKFVREQRGYQDVLVPGERIICLRNNRAFGLFNGQQAVVVGIGSRRRMTVDLTIDTEDGDRLEVPCRCDQFGQNVLADHRGNDVALFDYAYCLTAHKSQGSEYDEVIAVEEVSAMWNARRWCYTVATRAKNRLLYFR